MSAYRPAAGDHLERHGCTIDRIAEPVLDSDRQGLREGGAGYSELGIGEAPEERRPARDLLRREGITP